MLHIQYNTKTKPVQQEGFFCVRFSPLTNQKLEITKPAGSPDKEDVILTKRWRKQELKHGNLM